ncbi:hypothetical protein Leryth_026890 [Lithospermum erythrorhizon]|nr:hypothetical protein Leryth_026890 [Lithospermum erythrorhizon]
MTRYKTRYIPMLGEVMSAARGATNAFSGVERHVNSSLRTLGAKNIKAGVGCGIGFGHGFGVGLAVKPRVVHQIQSSLVQAFASMITRLGMVPSLSLGQSIVPQSLQSGVQIANQTINSSNTTYSSSQLFTSLPMISNVPTNRSEGMPPDPSSTKVDPLRTLAPTSRTEKVLSKFLENLMHEDGEQNEKAKHLHLENYMLQMVVKHQMLIQELMEENEKMRHILVEDLKIPPNKLQSSYPIRNKFSCSDCLDCRRKMRKR